jgi:hypothetical protein
MKTMEIQALLSMGESDGSIDSLISFIEQGRAQGATNYDLSYRKDVLYGETFLRLYRKRLDVPVKPFEITNIMAAIDAEKEDSDIHLCAEVKDATGKIICSSNLDFILSHYSEKDISNYKKSVLFYINFQKKVIEDYKMLKPQIPTKQ